MSEDPPFLIEYLSGRYSNSAESSFPLPDKIAFIDNNNKITYNELFIKVKTFAQSIRNIDINPNDRVLVCMDDSINYPIVFLGLIWAGVIPICINTMLPVKDYQYMIKDSCLLYTSPSPRDATLSRMPSCG